jgi:hypothetical protein
MADQSQAGPPIGTAILLVLAVVLYAGTMGSLTDAPNSDAMGRGMALAFGAILGTALIAILAVMLLVAAINGKMSPWGTIGAVVLLPLAMIAMWNAGDAYGRGDRSAIWVPALLPPLFLLYALRARFAPLRQKVGEGVANVVLGGAILLLAAAPLVRAAIPVPPDPVAEARAMAAEKEWQERQRLDEAARRKQAADFAKLGPDSSLADYLPFVSSDYSIEAREGMRKVKTRQADAVALLGAGRLGDLAGLLEYDIEATPELCTAYRTAIAHNGQLDLKAQRPNLEWLNGEGCDLAEPLARLKSR